jgi:hypothetical protein
MYALEQSLLVLALVGACGLAVKLLRGESGGHSCESGGSCGCGPTRSDDAPLTQIARRSKPAPGCGDGHG